MQLNDHHVILNIHDHPIQPRAKQGSGVRNIIKNLEALSGLQDHGPIAQASHQVTSSSKQITMAADQQDRCRIDA